MSDDIPAGESSAAVPVDAGSEGAGGAELLPSLALLAVAADPALAGFAAAQVDPMWDAAALGQADGHVYDGHVALVLDPGTFPGMDGTLDLLTTSADLFDVPAMDIGDAGNDASST